MTKKIFGVLLPDWVDEEALKKLVYSFLGLVLAVLVSILFVWPRFSSLYSEEKELARLEKSLKVLSESVGKVQEFEESLGENEVSSLELAVPKSFDPGLILSSLRQVGANAGVTIESYELDGGALEGEVEPESLTKHKVNLKLVGSSDRLIRFIDLLDRSLPISVISDLSLSEISKLFSQQNLSQLEMELTYFESGLVEDVALDKVVGFSSENKQLLDDIMLYSRPSLVTNDGTETQVERRGSIFGF